MIYEFNFRQCSWDGPLFKLVKKGSFLRQVGEQAGLVTALQALSDACGLQCKFYGQKNYPDAYRLLLKGTVHSQLPLDYEPTAEAFYNGSFHVFCHRFQRMRRGTEAAAASLEDSTATEEDEDEEEMDCAGCK